MSMIRLAAGVLLLFSLSIFAVAEEDRSCSKMPSELPEESCSEPNESVGTQWAILIAGSNGYWNYRHQADVCHAYQILKKGGLKDENIVVFMYDDIAYNKDNPRPGVIINHPNGSDVYKGVPKDYTGKDVNSNNFYAAILGDKTAIKGGSGKVVNSGPNDHIFIYYTDHGGPGVLAMPSGDDSIYANDLIDVLKRKHASGTYKSMVFYLEACESGSIFEGLLPKGLNIYATTASGADENSWGTYCPHMHPSPPPEYDTCLGDLYSVAWMEDCDVVDMRSETLKLQYERVKKRTIEGMPQGSHVMQYGNLSLSKYELYHYFGEENKNGDYTSVDVDSNPLPQPTKTVHQRDADLLHFWDKFLKSPEGSTRKLEAQTQIVEAMSHRMHVDRSMKMVGELVFGIHEGHKVLNTVRPAGQPLVDDWECLKSLVKTFERFCGSLSQYGMKHTSAIANMCNAGITKDQMAEAASQACSKFPTDTWTSRLYPQGF